MILTNRAVVRAAVIAVVVALSLAATAPADALLNSPKPKADGATVVSAGGFVPPDFLSTNLPMIHVAGGKVYIPAAIMMIYPGPAVNPVEERTPRASSLRSALLALYAAAKAPRGGWGEIRIADAPTTEVTVTVDGRTRHVSVYALGAGSFGSKFTSTQRQARERLTKALSRLEMISGSSRMYAPRQLEAWPARMLSDDPNFSATFPWPLPTVPSDCTVIAAADLPAGVNQASMFTVGSERFQMVFRPILPGEEGCMRR